jgi:prepilin-type N-terminal cleavage/methylation domain-containing protein
MQGRPAQRGFTTVELVIVLVLMAVLSAIALPRMTDRSALQERGARDQLRGLLHQARQTAVAQGRDMCVLFTATQARLVHVAGNACNNANPVLGRDGQGALALQMPPNVALAAPASLRFTARGQITAASDVAISVGSMGLVVRRDTAWVQ